MPRSPAQTHVFAYGSLLSPVSLLSTVPDTDLDDVVPARLLGHARVFDVAFPNDGSQPDKQYHDEHGVRPPFVLFANVSARPESSVNGVLVPVDDTRLRQLRARELRYAVRDCTAAIESRASEVGRVLAFVGRPSYTDPSDVARGVVARAYLDLIQDGARSWDERHPGFLRDFHAGTVLPDADRVVALARFDHPGNSRGSWIEGGAADAQRDERS
jgi:hypothetical protein